MDSYSLAHVIKGYEEAKASLKAEPSNSVEHQGKSSVFAAALGYAYVLYLLVAILVIELYCIATGKD